jgi:NAD(P)-dependent dehydrogenase (short-subunit alcohol dehydrogenase family)
MATISYGIEGKVVVVTGGSRGIGLDLAKMLLAQQAKVIICGRKQAALGAAEAELGCGENLLAVPAHIARQADVEMLFDQTLERFGRIDALVNNVGMNLITGLVDAEPALFNKIIESNLTGTWLCSRKAAQCMRAQKAGRIVSITSIAARRAAPFMGIYGIAKAAIEMMTKTLAQELAPFNIQVNAVAPCMVRTGFSQPFWSNDDLLKEIVKTITIGLQEMSTRRQKIDQDVRIL